MRREDLLNKALVDENVSDKEYRILALIINNCNFHETETIQMYHNFIAEKLNCSRRSVIAFTKHLEELGYISIERVSIKGKANTITLHPLEKKQSTVDWRAWNEEFNTLKTELLKAATSEKFNYYRDSIHKALDYAKKHMGKESWEKTEKNFLKWYEASKHLFYFNKSERAIPKTNYIEEAKQDFWTTLKEKSAF